MCRFGILSSIQVPNEGNSDFDIQVPCVLLDKNGLNGGSDLIRALMVEVVVSRRFHLSTVRLCVLHMLFILM